MEENSNPPKLSACGMCLAPGDSVNHLDHLAPIAYFMNVPMVIDEEFLIETMERYYPQVENVYVDHHAKILETIATNFDFLFVSCSNYRADLSPLFEIIFRKKIHFWYCPHGNSDKMYKQFENQAFVFIYGNQMKERLKEAGYYDTYDGIVRTGNYRLSFYNKYEEFYDNLVEEEVFSKFAKKQSTILYAPTWVDQEKNSSYFDVGLSIIDQLPDHYNLIIKIHPWMVHQKAGHVAHIEERYKDKPNVVVLPLYPLIYPLLKRTDIYLGDFSSVGYDFLYYNRPMFFFEPKKRVKDRSYSNHLHHCGVVIPESSYPSLFTFIENHLGIQETLKDARAKTYDDAYGQERDFDVIKQEVLDVLSTAKKRNDYQLS